MKNRKLHFLQCRHTGCHVWVTNNAVTVCPNCDRPPFDCTGNCPCRNATNVHYIERMILNAQGEKNVKCILDEEAEAIKIKEGLKKFYDFKKVMSW